MKFTHSLRPTSPGSTSVLQFFSLPIPDHSSLIVDPRSRFPISDSRSCLSSKAIFHRADGTRTERPNRFVALQLCPPLQFGPLTYQPIEWGFISSNQSALWSCLLHVTSQLGEGCSMSFVRFSVLIVWKTCVWNSFGAFSLMGFWRILQKFEVCSKLSSVNAYFHMLES